MKLGTIQAYKDIYDWSCAEDGNSMFFRCGHCLLYLFQFTTVMLPVTLSAVNAVTLVLTLPFMLLSSKLIGFVSNVSICPFKTFTVTFCGFPCRPSSAATSVLIYVWVLESSSRAFTFIKRSPFFTKMGTVCSPIKSVRR